MDTKITKFGLKMSKIWPFKVDSRNLPNLGKTENLEPKLRFRFACNFENENDFKWKNAQNKSCRFLS